jgi:membrane protein implicated in regulation of membrane protease activity
MDDFFGYALIGFIPLSLAALLLPGGFGTVFFLSIICTAGVSLVIWVPLSYLLGLLLVNVFELIFRRTLEVPQRPNLAARRKEVLRQFLQEACRQGMERDTATTLLRSNGWAESDIAWAFSMPGGWWTEA